MAVVVCLGECVWRVVPVNVIDDDDDDDDGIRFYFIYYSSLIKK